jgi:sporulation protein YlmC with PRC-barrel domain
MLAKYTIAALAGSAMLASAAFAQSPAATTTDSAGTPPAASSTAKNSTILSTSSLRGDWRASKMAGLSVYNDNNESVGSINDLLTDKSGTIKAVVIGVGGFLGVGEHLVAVPFDKVKFVMEPVAYTGASNTSGAGTTRTSSNTGPSTTTGAATTAPAASTSSSSSKSNPWYPDHAVFNATKDELKAMPEFKYSE